MGNVLVLPVDHEFIAAILFSEESVTEERVTVASQHILEVTGELIHIGMDVGISEEKGETEGFTELNLMYQMARQRQHTVLSMVWVRWLRKERWRRGR